MRESNIEIPVRGMSCQHCVMAVTRAVEQLGGVREVTVDLASATARVRFDADAVTAERLREAIRAAGYEVADG